MEYTIEAFVDKLLTEKGVTGLSPEIVQQLKSDLVDRAEDLINAEILAHMPKEHLEEFEKKLDSKNTDEIQKFCQEKIADLNQVVAGALVKLKTMYLASSLS